MKFYTGVIDYGATGEGQTYFIAVDAKPEWVTATLKKEVDEYYHRGIVVIEGAKGPVVYEDPEGKRAHEAFGGKPLTEADFTKFVPTYIIDLCNRLPPPWVADQPIPIGYFAKVHFNLS